MGIDLLAHCDNSVTVSVSDLVVHGLQPEDYYKTFPSIHAPSDHGRPLVSEFILTGDSNASKQLLKPVSDEMSMLPANDVIKHSWNIMKEVSVHAGQRDWQVKSRIIVREYGRKKALEVLETKTIGDYKDGLEAYCAGSKMRQFIRKMLNVRHHDVLANLTNLGLGELKKNMMSDRLNHPQCRMGYCNKCDEPVKPDHAEEKCPNNTDDKKWRDNHPKKKCDNGGKNWKIIDLQKRNEKQLKTRRPSSLKQFVEDQLKRVEPADGEVEVAPEAPAVGRVPVDLQADDQKEELAEEQSPTIDEQWLAFQKSDTKFMWYNDGSNTIGVDRWQECTENDQKSLFAAFVLNRNTDRCSTEHGPVYRGPPANAEFNNSQFRKPWAQGYCPQPTRGGKSCGKKQCRSCQGYETWGEWYWDTMVRKSTYHQKSASSGWIRPIARNSADLPHNQHQHRRRRLAHGARTSPVLAALMKEIEEANGL